MNICHVVTSISRKAAGVSKVILDLTEAMSVMSCDSNILTLEDAYFDEDRVLVKVPVLACRRHLWSKLAFSFDFQKRSTQQNSPDIVHSHGLWMYPNFAAGAISRRLKVPHLVSPHGMLEPWALQQGKMKKEVAWSLFQKNELERASVLHATAIQEANHFRAAGLQRPIAVIPNGVYLPEIKVPAKKTSEVKTFLFLSRIHPKKGLINLVNAWKELKPDNWRVVIAGPDGGEHETEVKRYVHELQLDDSFDFIGAVYEENKWEAYRGADVFILPSFSENFGIVIAEALASGIPVITTKATPWQDLVAHNCGWWIDVGVGPLVEAISDAIARSDSERFEMGQRGRQLIQNSYSWAKIASDMADVYEWVLGGGAPPSCVMTN